MRILIAGASGFLGTHLASRLRSHGHQVTTLVRREPGPGELRWDPYGSGVPDGALEGIHAVINLAGSPTAGNPHSRKWARELRESRVTTTRALASAIADCEQPPAFLAGNGISFYGDHGAVEVDENSDSRGHALLTEVTKEWQEATRPAQEAGARTAILRTAPVMDKRSAPLRQLSLLFGLGLGTRLGRGDQHFPMISLRDWVGAVCFLVESRDLSGPFNLCAPQTPTNAEFTKALAKALHRPAFLVAPAPILSRLAGKMAPEILGSVNARPVALERAGYDFHDLDVDDVLSIGLSGTR